MQTWQHIYDPPGNLWLSLLIATIPIIFFILALAHRHIKWHDAGTLTVAPVFLFLKHALKS